MLTSRGYVVADENEDGSIQLSIAQKKRIDHKPAQSFSLSEQASRQDVSNILGNIVKIVMENTQQCPKIATK
jgi:hypothetical protein